MNRLRTVLAVASAATASFVLLAATGAAAPDEFSPITLPQPEAQLNVLGTPFTGTNPDGSLKGFIDAHTHLMSNEGFGGSIVCGATYSPNGIADALQDCASHGKDGSTAIIENVTKIGGKFDPFAKHDTGGYPTFKDWPSPTSLTHQQMYYRWVERSWRGGQRILIAHTVNNSMLCKLPLQTNKYSCDDMDTVKRQIAATKNLQAFIDGQYGGPGKGWFRIVYSAAEAKSVVEQGKLAVILATEVSAPFGCGIRNGQPQCTEADIDRGLDELYALGVRSMFLCHKFDNALCGVRLDPGTQGLIVNAGNFINTGQFWDIQQCAPGAVADNTVVGGIIPGEVAPWLGIGTAIPVYPKAPHCNAKGLSALGEFALKGMMKRRMVVEVDHMSAKAAEQALQIMEQAQYPGLVSSHSWMDRSYRERLYKLGGFVTQYGNDTEAFVKEMREEQDLRKKYGVAYGFGMDMNGFGGTPRPRTPSPATAVQYPFASADGKTLIDRGVTGQRTFDINTDGVAHYGMIPDYLEDIRRVGGQDLVDELMRGANSYVSMWAKTQARPAAAPMAWGAVLGPSGAASAATPNNLATGATASASSQQWVVAPQFGADRAIDDNDETRWSSNWTWLNEEQWLAVDLGSTKQVRGVEVLWEKAFATDYQVQISADGAVWTTVADLKDADGGVDTVEFGAQPAQHVRVVMTKRGSGAPHYSVHSLRVIGD